ncbi:MAG: hypothetical protein U1E25_14455 [Methylocystis sp.]
MSKLAKTESDNSSAATVTDEKSLEENLREAMELSRALWMLMTGLTNRYPYQIGEKDLEAVCLLAEEVRGRTEAANRQWHEED